VLSLGCLPHADGRQETVETTIARKRLEEMRADLDRSIAVLQGEGPGPVAGSGYPQDSGDAGAILSEDTYGQCTDCGHEIPEGRLDARPDAARCVACQDKWAKRQR
jgi:hypothetical protein